MSKSASRIFLITVATTLALSGANAQAGNRYVKVDDIKGSTEAQTAYDDEKDGKSGKIKPKWKIEEGESYEKSRAKGILDGEWTNPD